MDESKKGSVLPMASLQFYRNISRWYQRMDILCRHTPLITQCKYMSEMHVQRSPFPVLKIAPTDVYSFLRPNFEKYSNRKALILPSLQKSYTYSELEDEVETVAFNMSQTGLSKGDTVAFCAQNSLEYAVMELATWRLGGSICSVSPLLTAQEIKQLLSIANPTSAFTDADRVEKLLPVFKDLTAIKNVFIRESHPECISFSTLTKSIPTGQTMPGLSDVDNHETACFGFTSGTTGFPKAVVLSHKSIVSTVTWMTEPSVCMAAKGHQMIFQPFSHLFALVLLTSGITLGSTSIVMEQFDLDKFLDAVSTYKVKSLIVVPPLVVLLAKHPAVDKYDLSHVTEIFSGAAPVRKETINELRKRLGRDIFFRQGYGLQEAIGCGTMSPVEDSPLRLPADSVGYPLGGVELKVVDIKTGNSLGPNLTGEIWMQTESAMTGYADNPTTTPETIDKDGWLHTGDIGYYKENSSFYIVDRLKEIIKYNAYQVAPAEIENLLLSHPLVADAAVIGVPDEKAGEVPLAWIVRKDETLTEKDVTDFVSENASSHKKLRGGVKFVDAIPKAPSGKLLRNEIRKFYKTQIDGLNEK